MAPKYALIPTILTLAAIGSSASGAVWTGGDGDWLDPLNWSPNDVPDSALEDALIDGGDTGAASTVTLDPPSGTNLTIGQLTIDAGDTFHFRPDGGTINVAGLSNSGTLTHRVSTNTNARDGFFNVAGTNQVFNAAGGFINIYNSTGKNRVDVIMNIDAQNQNDGAITLDLLGSQDRNTSRLRLENSGTFTNNGTILVKNEKTSTSSYVQLQLLTHSAAVTFGGTGSITLDVGAQADSGRARIVGASSTNRGTLTNGASHTINGAGLIGGSTLDLINDGLINATGDTAVIDVNTGDFVTNSATGRMVASGLAGMNIGGSGDTFTNGGLVEARTSSAVNINATSLSLGGEFRGGGTINIASLDLAGATVSPGDSANADGTGASTIGTLSVGGNAVFGDGSGLTIQLGAAGLSDTLAVTGDLDLSSLLDTLAIEGAGDGSSYTIATYAGTLTGTFDTVVGLAPNYSIDYGTGSNSQVTLALIPEPASLVLLGFGCLTVIGRNRRV